MFASNFPVDKIFNTFDNYWNSFKTITKNYSDNDKKCCFLQMQKNIIEFSYGIKN